MLSINPTARIVNAPTGRDEANKGYALYMAGQPIEACANIVQRRGFFAALCAASDAATDAYLSGGRS